MLSSFISSFMLLREKSMQIGNPPLISKILFWFVYTRLHSSRLVYNRLDSPCDPFTLVYIRLDSSSDSSTLVCIRLVTRLYSSTFVYTRLDSSSDLSSDSSVFLEQIYVQINCLLTVITFYAFYCHILELLSLFIFFVSFYKILNCWNSKINKLLKLDHLLGFLDRNVYFGKHFILFTLK